MTNDWRFSVSGETWRATIDAAPTAETKRVFWDEAVPKMAATHRRPPRQPCVVACHVRALGRWRHPPAGPLNRAKGLLDALHDDRNSGPWYRDLPGEAPLTDDQPSHVCGLAVEVRTGEPRTEYLLGSELAIGGELLASVPVEAWAPNDIVGTPGEKAKIAAGRVAFSAAVRKAFARYSDMRCSSPVALVVGHQPQRDEDNTWATWIAAACGSRGQGATHWAHGAPLMGWAPTSVASVADPALDSAVLYEVDGPPRAKQKRN